MSTKKYEIEEERNTLVIENINQDNIDSAVVDRNRTLLSLRASRFTIFELQLIDIYLGLIDTSSHEYQKIVLKKSEIERMLGVEKINSTLLTKALTNLQSKVVVWKEKCGKKSYKMHNITLLKTESYFDEAGAVIVTLECIDRDARDYIYTGPGASYLKYRLSEILSLKSKYAYVLYQYLLDNKFRDELINYNGEIIKQSWRVSADDLKNYLNCSNMSTGRFSENVLSRAKVEIETKTSLRYSIKAIKDFRKITDFEIIITSYSPNDQSNNYYALPNHKNLISQSKREERAENDPEYAESVIKQHERSAEYHEKKAEYHEGRVKNLKKRKQVLEDANAIDTEDVDYEIEAIHDDIDTIYMERAYEHAASEKTEIPEDVDDNLIPF